MLRTETGQARALLLALTCVGGAFVVFNPFNPPRDSDPEYSDEAAARAQAIRQEVEAELKRLGDHEWAGEYFHGDGLGVNVSLRIAPKTGYVFEWHGCLGLYDRNYGSVTDHGDRLSLSFTFPNSREGFGGIAPELVKVRWGDRMYLIPTDEVIGFCNDVNGGAEPRDSVRGFHLLRVGDEQKEATDRPELPAEFVGYLLPGPITAEIIHVGAPTTRPSKADWLFLETPVMLNKGRAAGVQKGMRLHVITPTDIVRDVVVMDVAEDTCEAVMTQMGQDAEGPQAGWSVSTRPQWK